MARRVKIEVGALNVRLHPHPDGTYVDFVRAIYQLRRPIHIRGDRVAVIRSLVSGRSTEGEIHGVIATYLSIDMNQPWFNEDTFEVATKEDLEEVSLPDHLHPNVNSFYFMLDAENHRIYFEHYSRGKVLTHNSALRFFDESASQPEIRDKFGKAKIGIVQSRKGLAEIFSLNRITELKVFIEKPNDVWPDDFEEHLEKKNARSMTVTYKSEQGLGLIRDDDLQELTEASLDNGYTEASGYGPSGHVRLSTERFPKTAQEKFDPDEKGTEISMFRRVIDLFKRGK
jgi:Domain of unknown function (DUF4747)